jgi:hypothetical protein
MIISPSAISPYKIPTFQSGGAPFVGLLDTYPNAPAAYSVRQLSSDYAKPTDSEFSFGNALEFDGADDYVDFSTINLTDTYTLSFWVKDWAATKYLMGGVSGNAFLYGANTTTIWLRHYDGATASSIMQFTVNNINDGDWHHYMITSDGSNCRLYQDGVESTSGAIANGGIHTYLKYLGARATLVSSFGGILDEVSAWVGTTGTAQNTIDLYNSGNGALASDIIASPTAYWRANETSGTTLTDETGSYNGTLNNFDTPTCWVDGKANKGALVEIAGYTTTPTFVENKTFYPDENNELSLTSTDAVGTTLASWLSTNSITEGYVRTLYDQSGNANNAQQTTASLQPIIISSGSIVTDNGEPAIDFIGGDYYLILSSTITSQWAFGVQNATAIDNAVNYLYGGAGEGYHVGGTTGSITGWGAFSAAGSRESNNEGLGQKIRAWDGNKLFENGVEESYSDTGNAGDVDIIVLGTRSDFTAFSFTGFFQEVVFYNSNQEANVVGIYENQNSRYNVVV